MREHSDKDVPSGNISHNVQEQARGAGGLPERQRIVPVVSGTTSCRTQNDAYARCVVLSCSGVPLHTSILCKSACWHVPLLLALQPPPMKDSGWLWLHAVLSWCVTVYSIPAANGASTLFLKRRAIRIDSSGGSIRAVPLFSFCFLFFLFSVADDGFCILVVLCYFNCWYQLKSGLPG